MGLSVLSSGPARKPWGLKWRSSVAFVTAAVGVGITTDLLVYSIIIPVMPFQLEHLKFHNVSALTGWLLCAYSLGLVLSTMPIAIFAERSSSRRTPLIIGLLALLGAQLLLMEAPNYALMAIARILQGISSSVVWVVGLALLCDTTPEKHVGRQLGIAMTGLSVGLMVGTPAGGTLYARFGFRGPFIFGEICTVVDLILRFLIIERDVAIRWGYDPATCQDFNVVADLEASSSPQNLPDTIGPSAPSPIPVHPISEQTPAAVDPKQNPSTLDPRIPSANNLTMSEITLVRKPLPTLTVIRQLGKSPRAMAALIMSLIYGTVNSMQEPSLPLHLQSVWGYNSGQVGLVYMAGLVPALISSPLSGFLADRIGSDYITSICLLLALPWWIVLVIRKSIAVFVVALAMQSFFVSGVVAPVTAELATVSRRMEGVGYAHVYGAFNLAFGIGTAVGPIIGGQVYGRTKHGWTALCCLTAAFILLCMTLAFCYTGDDPLLSKVMREQSRPQASLEMKPLKKQRANTGNLAAYSS